MNLLRQAVTDSPTYPYDALTAPVKLDQNEGVADFPAELKQLVLQRIAGQPWHRYPDLHLRDLSGAIARHDDWPASGVVVTTGSNVMIPVLIQLTALRGHVVTTRPNFGLYSLDARLMGATLIEESLNEDFTMDVARLIDRIGQLPAPASGEPRGIIFISQPHAPTGTVAPEASLERLAQAAGDWLLVIDEAYHQFARTDATGLARRYPNIVLLRTFSKAWGLAGLRLGYALASDTVAANLRKLVPPFGVSVMQDISACVALAHPDYVEQRVQATIAERERVTQALAAHPSWQVVPSSTNFLLIRTPDAARAHAQLLDAGVLVRRQDSLYGLSGCIRVTIGTPEQNNAFLTAAGVDPAG